LIRNAAACAVVCAAIAWSRAALAVDPFEIQVYDPDLRDLGAFGAELHSNFVFTGQSVSEAPELPNHHVLHETLELSYGLASFFELGGYLQTALQPSGGFEYAGVKLRGKVALPEVQPLRFAVNAELSYIPSRYDRARWGGELRPIIEWKAGDFTLDVNPIVSFTWTGPHAAVPRFEPAVATRYALFKAIELGLEYYGGYGPLDAPLPRRAQDQFLFETVDVIALEKYEIHAGIGEGLSSASSGIVAKVILGHEF
jgi:hypothetical protein